MEQNLSDAQLVQSEVVEADKAEVEVRKNHIDLNLPIKDSNKIVENETVLENIEFVTSSQYEQPKELTEFLKAHLTKNPYNKYCIDCKKNQTTHALIWLGTLVCEGCAIGHQQFPDYSMSKNYIKNVYKDQWDDYQLRSIQIGGN